MENNVFNFERACVVLGDKLANGAKALGRATEANEKANQAIVNALYANNAPVTFFKSEEKGAGEMSEQRLAFCVAFATGKGAINPAIAGFTNYAQLVGTPSSWFAERKKELKEMTKNAKSKKDKAKLSKQSEDIDAASKLRSTVMKQISGNFRDLTAALITRHKDAARKEALAQGKTSEQANLIADKLGNKLKDESGFSIKRSNGEKALLAKAEVGQKPTDNKPIAKVASKLLELVEAEKDVKKLGISSSQFLALTELLSKLIGDEPNF